MPRYDAELTPWTFAAVGSGNTLDTASMAGSTSFEFLAIGGRPVSRAYGCDDPFDGRKGMRTQHSSLLPVAIPDAARGGRSGSADPHGIEIDGQRRVCTLCWLERAGAPAMMDCTMNVFATSAG